MLNTRTLLIAATLVSATLAPERATAYDLGEAYENNPYVLQVRISSGRIVNGKRVVLASIVPDNGVIKGCLPAGTLSNFFSLTLPDGSPFNIRETVIVAGDVEMPSTTSFFQFGGLFNGFVAVFSERSVDIHRAGLTPFLLSRQQCCDGECVCFDGSTPTQCSVDPCSLPGNPTCGQGTCEATSCGGCGVIHRGPVGTVTCNPSCRFDSCGPGACVTLPSFAKECRLPCAVDDDCQPGFFCGDDQFATFLGPMNHRTCAPFGGDGDSCGPDDFSFGGIGERRCDPLLTCIGGICINTCATDADCPLDAYCGQDGMCRPDGSCAAHTDCAITGNSYVKEDCFGFPTCAVGQCMTQCVGECIDLTSPSAPGKSACKTGFGVGWGIGAAGCSLTKACTDSLFATEEDCLLACFLNGQAAAQGKEEKLPVDK